MSAFLDTMASRAVYAARLFERAVHDPGPWTVEVDGVHFPVERILDEGCVRFHGDLAISSPGPVRVGLHCRGELVSVRDAGVRRPSSGATELTIDWAVELAPAAV